MEVKLDLTDFHRELIETVRARAEATRDFIRTSFVEECGNRLVEAEEFVGFELCRFEGISGKKRLRIDGYWLDDTDNSVSLIISDFNNDDQLISFNTSDVKKTFEMLRAFLEEALEGNLTDGSFDESQPGYGLACDLMDWHLKVTKYRLYFVSDGQLKTRVKEWSEPEIKNVKVELHIWDVNRFYLAYISATGRDELVIDFSSQHRKGIPCLTAGHSEGEYQAYLCMITGDALADVYEQYGSRLLEGNVRTFLSTKGKVNAGIQNTIRERPDMFFAFNNGIAATAENVILDKSDGQLVIKSATNLQIVNGGQTTASLAFAKRGGNSKKEVADLSKVMVQMKLSVLPSDKAGVLIPDIAKYANNQNKVSDADFFSNHPFHIRLEDFSRRIFTSPLGGAQHGTHWFYERARGQYTNEQAKLTPAQKTHFLLQNPKSQLFTKTDVAKYENSWKELPHKVSLGAQKNFVAFAETISKTWASDGKIYNEEYFRNLVALAIIFRRTEQLIGQQPWYQGGYRANIVTYTLAKLHNMISEGALGQQLNLRAIWDNQSVSQVLQEQITAISKAVFTVLTDENRPKDNVTEWAKMQACWEQVRQKELAFSLGFIESLQDIKLANEVSRGSIEIQTFDNGIEMQINVVETPGVEWSRMLNWGIKKALLTPQQETLLKIAAKIPSKLPTERQSIKIWKIRDSLIANGYIAL